MRTNRAWKWTILLGGFAVAVPASAQKYPAGWAKVETVAYTMALPKDFIEFRTKKDPLKNVKDPIELMRGAWGFMSKNAGIKVFIRVVRYRKGMTLRAAFDRGLQFLKRKVIELKPLQVVPTPADKLGRDMIFGFFTGATMAVDKKTKKTELFRHLIVRVLQRYPDVGLNVVFTYMFGPDRAAQAQAFVEQHQGTFMLHSPKEVQQVVKVTVKPEPKKPVAKGKR